MDLLFVDFLAELKNCGEELMPFNTSYNAALYMAARLMHISTCFLTICFYEEIYYCNYLVHNFSFNLTLLPHPTVQT